jgi:hypothetical protein
MSAICLSQPSQICLAMKLFSPMFKETSRFSAAWFWAAR